MAIINESERKFVWKIIKVIVPSLLVLMICFFVHNWQDGLATKTDLLESYSKSEEIKFEYITVAEYNKNICRINAKLEKVDEMYDDMKLMLFGMATMHPELRDVFLKNSKLPEKFKHAKGKKRAYKLAAGEGG